MKKEQYQEALDLLDDGFHNLNNNDVDKIVAVFKELIDERQQLINALKEINEILERLTLEQKKSLGATVYTIQALIAEMLDQWHYKEREGLVVELIGQSKPMKPKGLSISHEGRLGNCPNCNKVVWEFDDSQYHTDKECLQMLDWSRP